MHYNKLTKMVSADTRKGYVVVKRDDNGYTEFSWMERESEVPELRFILLPGDAEYRQVKEARNGRVYLLDIKANDEKHFFWMQETSAKYDEKYMRKINEFISGTSIIDIPFRDISGNLDILNLIKSNDLISFLKQISDDGDNFDDEEMDEEDDESSSVGGEFITLTEDYGTQEPESSTCENNLIETLLENIPEDEHKSAIEILLSKQHVETMGTLEEAHINGDLEALLKSHHITIPSGRGSSSRINEFLNEVKNRITKNKESKDEEGE